MRTQQSFHPVLPNVVLYDRMFRVKPYTKCMDCLIQDKLRCQNCMEIIIEEIAKKSKPLRVPDKRVSPFSGSQHLNDSPENKRLIKTSYSTGKLNVLGSKRIPFRRTKDSEEKIMITSKYNWWLNQKKKKRQQDPNLTATLTKNWPRKTKVHDYNLEKLGAKQPRFQKWEKKLLDQLLSKTNRIL